MKTNFASAGDMTPLLSQPHQRHAPAYPVQGDGLVRA
jgi:hypothetical protein